MIGRGNMRILAGIIAFVLLSGAAWAQSAPICFKTSASQIGCQPVTTSTFPLPVTGTFTPSASSPEFTPVAPNTATATSGVLLGGQYDSTQKTLTNGQQAAISVSPRGAVYVGVGAEAFTVQPGNTANTTPWLVTTAGDSFTNVTTNTDTVIKASAGTFKGISVNTLGTTSTVVVYNNTTCTGAKIGTFSTILQNSLQINAAASTGICVTTAGAGAADITVYYR